MSKFRYVGFRLVWENLLNFNEYVKISLHFPDAIGFVEISFLFQSPACDGQIFVFPFVPLHYRE